MSKIQQAESNLCEFVKIIESQLENHEKAITTLFNNHKSTQESNTPSPTPSITEETVVNIVASITAEQKEKRQLNIIIRNLVPLKVLVERKRILENVSLCFKHIWDHYVHSNWANDQIF